MAIISSKISERFGSLEFELVYNQKNKDSSTLDFFGIDNLEIIDSVVCILKNNKDFDFAKETNLIFHQQGLDMNNDSIVVGLQLGQ